MVFWGQKGGAQVGDKERDRQGVTVGALYWGQPKDGSIFIHWHL